MMRILATFLLICVIIRVSNSQFRDCMLQCTRQLPDMTWQHVITCLHDDDEARAPPGGSSEHYSRFNETLHEESEGNRQDCEERNHADLRRGFESPGIREEQKIERRILFSALERPVDCAAWKEISPDAANGVYRIYPPRFDPDVGIRVYCDMTTDDYDASIVFQRRFDGSLDFDRSSEDYEKGFGDVAGEHWLGLQTIRKLTEGSGEEWELRVDLEGTNHTESCAKYSDFYIGKGPGYELHIGEYSGTAGDALGIHQGCKFTTRDRDMDELAGGNCALTRGGAWWHGSCGYSNLNGRYEVDEDRWQGVLWFQWKGVDHSLIGTEMKMKKIHPH